MFNVVGGKTSQIVVLGWVMGHGGALHVPCLEGFDSPPPRSTKGMLGSHSGDCTALVRQRRNPPWVRVPHPAPQTMVLSSKWQEGRLISD